MRFTPSPLVGSMSGKTAGLVAATWKGRPYIRALVTPANPQSAAQTLVRNSLARCVPLWRSLDADVKAWLDIYGTGYRMSGFNVFMQKCRAAEQAGALLAPVPANPHAAAPPALAFSAGASGVIAVNWTPGSAPSGYAEVQAVARLATGNVFNATSEDVDAEGETHLTGLTPGEDYDCYAWYLDDTTPFQCGTSGGELAVTSGA